MKCLSMPWIRRLLAQFCMARGEGIMPQVYRAQVSGEAASPKVRAGHGALGELRGLLGRLRGRVGERAGERAGLRAAKEGADVRADDPLAGPRVLALRGRKRRVWRRSRSFLRRRGGTEPK